MTYFTIDDPEEPVQIKDAKGKWCGFCVGADLSEKNSTRYEEFDENEDQARKQQLSELPDMLKQDENAGVFKKAFFWMCGIEKKKPNNSNSNTSSEPQKADTSLEQNRFWSTICDINAVIAIGLSGFCFAFFNKYN